jgi:N-acetyl-alpha-D-glucosaminyl L-malate synthase BshA
LVGRDPSFEPVITFCINESDAVTAVSQSLKNDTYTHFQIERPIHVIPNFIDVDSENESAESIDLRCKYALPSEKIMCHISNFRAVKRVEDVVHVFKRVSDKLPVKLLLAGDGPERQGVERLVREYQLQQKVIFLGKVRDTSHVLQLADLFLLPSETESFGLAALEAMAVGVPVISSNTGGIPEVNEHGVTGFLSPVGNVEEMAQNSNFLLENEGIHGEFAANAKERARLFDLDLILPLYEQVYADVLNRD